jgi:hypothetical protein
VNPRSDDYSASFYAIDDCSASFSEIDVRAAKLQLHLMFRKRFLTG